MSEQEKEVTQPVVVKGFSAVPSSAEGTQPVQLAPEAAKTQMPEWLLKFASSPEQPAQQSEPGETAEFQIPFYDEMEEEQDFSPPVMDEEVEWQELSDFHDQEAPDMPEAAEPPINAAVPAEPDEAFGQEIRDLLENGKYQQAFTLIRENEADPVMTAAAKQSLRSHLTLASEADGVWEIYDELNKSSL